MNIAVQAALKNHVQEYELSCSDQDAFEHFFNYIVLRNYTSRHFNPEIMGTEEGEVGIDGFAIIVNDTVVTSLEEVEGIFRSHVKDINVEYVFTQAKTSEKFSADEITLFLAAVKNFFGQKENRINMNAKMNELAKISDYILVNTYKLNPNPSCLMYYATNGVWQENPVLQQIIDDGKRGLQEFNIFSEVVFTPYDQNKIINSYREIKNSIRKQITVEQSAPIPKIDNVEEAYIGIVKCIDYLRLICDENDKLMANLFEDNVRYFQGANTVNMEIANTINDDSCQKNFVLLNNGITIVAKEVRRTGTTFCLSDFQIVNGCQTSFMLYNNRQKLLSDTAIILKLVATKDSDLTGSIIKATNRQTPIQSEAFETLRHFHKKLEAAYSSYEAEYRLFYERRSKQYEAEDINKNKIISFSVQINCYVSMFLAEPQSTHRYYGEILEANNKKIFREDDVLQQYCISAIYLYLLEKWLKENRKDKYKVYKYHIILIMRLLVDSDSLPLPNSKKMATLCEKLFAAVKIPTQLNHLFNAATEIIEKTCTSLSSKPIDKSIYPRSKEFTTEMLGILKANPLSATFGGNVREVKPGEIFNCKVIGMNSSFVFVEIIETKDLGEIHISEIAYQYIYNIRDVINVGDLINAKVLDIPKHDVYGYKLSKKQAL